MRGHSRRGCDLGPGWPRGTITPRTAISGAVTPRRQCWPSGGPMTFNVTRLNHAVLFVRDVDRAADFYQRVSGFEELERSPGMRAAFMRAPGGENHHDLGLFEVGAEAPRP